jgi:protein TonB
MKKITADWRTKKESLDKINLKPYRLSISLMSYCIVFSLLIGLFSWRTYETEIDPTELFAMSEDIEMEIPPTTQPPPPPPPPVIQIVVKKDDEIIKEKEIPETEKDEDDEIDIEFQDEKVDEEEIWIVVQENPEFPGGTKALFEYMNKNTRYPAQATEMDLEGMVIVQFVVNKKGEINDIKILKSLGGGCDEEAIRVVKSMPKWKPGKQQGRRVNVSYNLPFRFQMF